MRAQVFRLFQKGPVLGYGHLGRGDFEGADVDVALVFIVPSAGLFPG